MREILLLIVFSLFLALTATQTVAAQSPHDRARDAVRSGQIRPLNEVLSVVRSRFGGRVMDVELLSGRQPVYRVKLLTPRGDVMLVMVDARSARIMSARGGGRR